MSIATLMTDGLGSFGNPSYLVTEGLGNYSGSGPVPPPSGVRTVREPRLGSRIEAPWSANSKRTTRPLA